MRGTTLAARGWTQEGGDLWETLDRLDGEGCARYVVTDVNKDGMLKGPNVDLLREVCARTDRPVVASGGVSTLEDVRVLRTLVGDGVEGAIIGSALYRGRVHAARGPRRGRPAVTSASPARRRLATANPYEERYGYSRALRTGDRVLVSGCTSVVDGVVLHPGDAAAQARVALDTAVASVVALGGRAADIVLTRMYVVDRAACEAVGLVHGERFAGCGRWPPWWSSPAWSTRRCSWRSRWRPGSARGRRWTVRAGRHERGRARHDHAARRCRLRQGCPGPGASSRAPASTTTAARVTRGSWRRSATPGREAELVAAVAAARLLVPVVAAPAEVDTSGELAVEKSTDMAAVTLTSPDGQRALPVFSSMAALTRWDPAARPVPVTSARAAQAAVSERCEVMLLDLGAEHAQVLRPSMVWALAQERAWLPAHEDPFVTQALTRAVQEEPDGGGVHR